MFLLMLAEFCEISFETLDEITGGLLLGGTIWAGDVRFNLLSI